MLTRIEKKRPIKCRKAMPAKCMSGWCQLGMRVSFSGVLALAATTAHAFGLGQIQIQSTIGQPLRVDIPLLGNDVNDVATHCVKSRLMSPDGEFLTISRINLRHTTPALTVTTANNINEPAVILVLELNCGAQIQRDYQILLDPPNAAVLRRSASLTEEMELQEHDDTPSIAAMAGMRDRRVKQKTMHYTRPITPSIDTAQKQMSPARSNRLADEPARDVLRLSAGNLAGDTATDGAGLRLSISTSLSAIAGSRDAAELQSLRAAHARFLAQLRDDGKDNAGWPDAEAKLHAMQTKIQALEIGASQLRKIIDHNKAALQASEKQRVPVAWLAGSIASLLASFAAIVWLVWRLTRLKASDAVPDWQDDLANDQGPKEAAQQNSATVHTIVRYSSRNSGADHALPDKVTTAHADDASYDYAPRFNRPHIEIPKVEEISDVVQQAEFWMLMENSQRAVEVLEEYGSVDSPSSPLPWLYLFDLYRSLGQRQKYEILLARYRRIFNGKVPKWEDQADADQSHGLEDLPHLAEKITSLWQTENIVPFLENILIDDRGGMREGFNLLVYRDIIFLLGIAYEISQAKKYIKPAFYVPRWELAS